jgi:hypothetical protein
MIMEPKEIEKMLFVSASKNYGDKYIEHLLEQYKIYIASAEKISDRRQKANEFFLALNSAFVTLLGFVVSKTSHAVTETTILLAAVSGIVMCYLWYRMIRSYKGLNDGKFKVIHSIEVRLPLALYDTEWEMLGRGMDRKIYWPFTHIELWVPWIFVMIYVTIMVTLVTSVSFH